MKIKFMWNGIKVDGKLYRAHYSRGARWVGGKPQGDFITIYARDLLVGLPKLEGETIENNTDSQTDYFETDRLVLSPNSRYFEMAAKAHEAQQQHYVKTAQRRAAKRLAK